LVKIEDFGKQKQNAVKKSYSKIDILDKVHTFGSKTNITFCQIATKFEN